MRRSAGADTADLHLDRRGGDEPAGRAADGRAHVVSTSPARAWTASCSSRPRCGTSRSRYRPSSGAWSSAASSPSWWRCRRRPGRGAARPATRPPARGGRSHRARLVLRADRRQLARRDRRPARSLEEMRTRLEALERSRSAFIANASHELRTPLTALGGYLELLTEGGLTDAERGEFLETMGEQVQRLTKLATDLLDLSRLDAGGITVGKDELDLGKLAADAPVRCSRREPARLAGARRRGPRTRRRPRRRGTRAAGAARARRQRPAAHAGGLDGHAAHGDHPWGASIIVSDNGPGIPPELLERVFERFYRAPARPPRIGPRAGDRARAGRAHGGPAARHERPRGHPLRARAAGRWGGRGRLHWVIVTARAALAGVVIALVAGLAGGALALALTEETAVSAPPS